MAISLAARSVRRGRPRCKCLPRAQHSFVDQCRCAFGAGCDDGLVGGIHHVEGLRGRGRLAADRQYILRHIMLLLKKSVARHSSATTQARSTKKGVISRAVSLPSPV
jgi:hypothetical protein